MTMMNSNEIKEMERSILDRFLRYVRIDTQSNHHNPEKPTTPGQWNLLKMLKKELHEIGLKDIDLDQNGYLIARIPSTLPAGRKAPVIGFMAHVDTAADMSGKNVNPQIIEHYDGNDIPLGGEWVLSSDTNPELLKYQGVNVVKDSNKNNMHHKVFIIDEEIVITGSYNPTGNGNKGNDENVLIIYDKDIASRFIKEFDSLVSS